MQSSDRGIAYILNTAIIGVLKIAITFIHRRNNLLESDKHNAVHNNINTYVTVLYSYYNRRLA